MEQDDRHTNEQGGDLSRRDVVKMAVGAALATSAGSAAASGGEPADLVEKDVEIKTPDGTCDAALIYPRRGAHPAVIVWTDAFGLRPSMRDIGKRIAADGYTVLVPNPFYRAGSAATLGLSPATISFSNPDDRAKLGKVMGTIQAAGAAEMDAATFVAFLDAQPQVNRRRKMGTQGYCMGGALVFRTAAAQPERVGAGASFHGGGLVTESPESPHLLVPKIKARMYVAIAASDDERQPDAKDKLRAAFAAAHVPAEVEVYPTQHGWCVPDMAAREGKPIYNKPEAEKAWAKLVTLYKTALA